MVVPDTAVPETVGVVVLVLSSSEAVPVSLAASRSGVPGAAGAEVSTVTDRAAAAAPLLPAPLLLWSHHAGHWSRDAAHLQRPLRPSWAWSAACTWARATSGARSSTCFG